MILYLDDHSNLRVCYYFQCETLVNLEIVIEESLL